MDFALIPSAPNSWDIGAATLSGMRMGCREQSTRSALDHSNMNFDLIPSAPNNRAKGASRKASQGGVGFSAAETRTFPFDIESCSAESTLENAHLHRR